MLDFRIVENLRGWRRLRATTHDLVKDLVDLTPFLVHVRSVTDRAEAAW
ncbi:MAG: hypothetical protein AAGN82_22325 [Myxococcota bacterium]